MREIVGNLEAEISVTELRDQELLSERLACHHAVRVRRRGEMIGVLLDSELWTDLLERVEHLQAANEQYEDEAALALVAARSGGDFVPATDEAIDDVLTQFEVTVRSRRESERGS